MDRNAGRILLIIPSFPYKKHAIVAYMRRGAKETPPSALHAVRSNGKPSVACMTALPATFICGVVRNASAHLTQTLDRIKGLEAICENSFALIVTNDNMDKTDEVLRAWRSSSANHQVLWLDGLQRAFPERLDRIAAARNFCLQQLQSRPEALFPFTLVMDLDGPNKYLSADTVLQSLSSAGFQWDGIFANQRQAYYDIYALRHDQWCPGDCWEEVRRATTFPGRSRKARLAAEKFVYSRQFRIRPDHPPIAVKSAFGGLAVYRTEAIKGLWYAARDKDSRLTCEHVLFNEVLLEKGGKLFIAPSLLNDAPIEHLGPVSGAELKLEL